MQASRGLQLALICGVGALFFVAALLSQGGAISNGMATGILAGACLVVLAGVFLLVRQARSAASGDQAAPAPRTGRVVRATGFVLGIVLIELMQLGSLPVWARTTCGLCGTAAIAWAVVALRRSRRG